MMNARHAPGPRVAALKKIKNTISILISTGHASEIHQSDKLKIYNYTYKLH